MCKLIYRLAACGHGILYNEEDWEYCKDRPVSPYGPGDDTCFDHPHYEQICLGLDPDDECVGNVWNARTLSSSLMSCDWEECWLCWLIW